MLFHKVDPSSVNSVTSALDLFTPPPTNVAINNAEYREILSLNPVSVTPLHFKLNPGSNFVDLSKSYLITEMKILKQGTGGKFVDLPNDSKVGCIQLPGATFIKNLRVSFNGRQTFDSNSLFAYKAYIDAEFTYADDVKKTYLAAAGYAPDDTNLDADTNNGNKTRQKYFEGGKTAQFLTRLDADIFNQELYLIPGVDVDIEIQTHKPEFFVHSPSAADTDVFKLEIVSCKLFAKYVELMAGLNINIASALNKLPAKYAVRRTEMKSFTITEGRYHFTTTLFADQVPRRLFYFMVATDAFTGNIKKTPFALGHFNLRESKITANGRNYPSVPYDMDFTKKHFMRAFHDLHENLGLAGTTETNGITPLKYHNGHFMLAANLTNSQENDVGFDLIKQGTTSIEMKFSEAIPAGGVMLIVYAEMDSIINIDKNRTVTSDTTV